MLVDYKEHYKRQTQIALLNKELKACHKCPGLNEEGITENAPGFGSVLSPVMLVGQSLCTACMKSQMPFTGGSGELIDQALNIFELSRHKDVFITNVVHCHPPKNRPSDKKEIQNCRRFLHREIEIIQPKLIVALGMDAKKALTKMGMRFSSIEGAKRRTSVTNFGSELSNFPTKSMWLRHPASFLYNPDKSKEAQWKVDLGKAIKDEC